MFISLVQTIECGIMVFAMWTFLHWYKNNTNDESVFAILVHIYEYMLLVFRRQTFQALHVKKFKDGRRYSRFIGLYHFTKPVLMIRDPDLIKQVMTKDANCFVVDHDYLPRGVDDFWDANISSLVGSQHHRMRMLVAPAFTKPKIKALFKFLNQTTLQFIKFLHSNEDYKQEFEAKETFQRLGSDIFAHCMLGIRKDSFVDRDNDFYMNGKELNMFQGGWKKWIQESCRNKHLGKMMGIKAWNGDSAHFFFDTIRETMEKRAETGLKKGDLLDSFMPKEEEKEDEEKIEEGEKVKGSEDGKNIVKEIGYAAVEEIPRDINQEKLTTDDDKLGELSDVDIAAQIIFFFGANHDAVSTALTFLCYELARHASIQQKLRVEVDSVKAHFHDLGEITYEAICDMEYMDMVVSESLRKWPPTLFIQREAVQDYRIPRTLTTMEDYPYERDTKIERGSSIVVPIFALHRCEEFFRNPDVFDPTRFEKRNKRHIKPYTYLPFGTGTRNCLGSRFVLMQIKVVIFHILVKYRLFMVRQTRLHLAKGVPRLDLDQGMWLGLEKRSF